MAILRTDKASALRVSVQKLFKYTQSLKELDSQALSKLVPDTPPRSVPPALRGGPPCILTKNGKKKEDLKSV